MMDMYSLHKLAHTEHEMRVRSLPTVPEYPHPNVVEQSYWARLLASLRAVGAHLRTARRNQPHATRPTLTLSNPSQFLRDQFREDSNHETDWLWAASQATAPEEIRYCLERALHINPDNPVTQRTLSELIARRADANETVQVNEQDFAQASSNN
jgi:hypothetical protein